MTELTKTEVEEVNGGIVPVIVAGMYLSGKALASGFALGVAMGSLYAYFE